jgi:hypothetical protein
MYDGTAVAIVLAGKSTGMCGLQQHLLLVRRYCSGGPIMAEGVPMGLELVSGLAKLYRLLTSLL